MSETNRQSLVLGEPFRVFFPTGMVLGIMSVMLWPLYELGWLHLYPSVMHARILILGYIGLFVLGFLGTAFPRLLGVKGMNGPEFVVCSLLVILSQGAYLSNHIGFGDVTSLVLWTLVIAAALFRIGQRSDMPPPSFILAAGALLSLWISLGLNAYADLFTELGYRGVVLSRTLMYEAFPTLIILGVAPYFFPKILGGPNRYEFDVSRIPSKAWLKLAGTASVATILALFGFVWKTQDQQLGTIIVSAVLFAYIFIEIPLFPHSASAKGSMALGLLLGISGIFIGTLSPALFPQFRIGVFHILTLCGVSVILTIVSIRVIHGHAGRVSLTFGWKKRVLVLPLLLIVAGLTRLSADALPKTHSSHLVYASLIFLISGVIWLWLCGAHLLREEQPTTSSSEVASEPNHQEEEPSPTP